MMTLLTKTNTTATLILNNDKVEVTNLDSTPVIRRETTTRQCTRKMLLCTAPCVVEKILNFLK